MIPTVFAINRYFFQLFFYIKKVIYKMPVILLFLNAEKDGRKSILWRLAIGDSGDRDYQQRSYTLDTDARGRLVLITGIALF